MPYASGEIEPFTPGSDDWQTYKERLDLYFEANDVADAGKKRAKFLTIIGPTCYKVLRNLCSPDLPSSMSYTDLLGLLDSHFQPIRIEVAERYRFYQRKQADGESIQEYMAELRKLSEHCNFGPSLDAMLRDTLVLGVRSENTRRNLLKERSLTLKLAIEIAEATEAVDRDLRKLRQGAQPATVHKVQKKPYRKPISNAAIRPNVSTANARQCYRCGDPSHMASACLHKNKVCDQCKKKGHLAKVCRGGIRFGSQSRVHANTSSTPDESNGPDTYPVYNIQEMRPPIMVPLKINGKSLKMELDTASYFSIIGEPTAASLLQAKPLKPSDVKLLDYNKNPIKIKGQIDVTVTYGNTHVRKLPLLVAYGSRASLMGRNWLGSIRLDWNSLVERPVNQVQDSQISIDDIDRLKAEFPDVFSSGLGKWKGPPAKIRIHPEAKFTPKFFKPRSVPMALRGKVDQALDDLVKADVLESIDHSDCAAPIVTVIKPNGDVRICGDFKVTVNPFLHVDQYPMPTMEETLLPLSGASEYSVLDMNQAFLQIPIDEESQNLLVINTHKGLFKYKRLPFGVAPASAILQRRLESLIKGIPFTANRVDDIITGGTDRKSHLQHLRAILKRFQNAGLKLNWDKGQFFRQSVTYLAHVIDKDGIRPSQANVKAILDIPIPKNVDEVQSFVGAVNYYSKFIPDMSTLLAPLNQLRRKGQKFHWSQDCQKAFDKVKKILTSPQVLTHYDPQLRLVVQCDASPVGVGAVMSHIFPDGTERPIAYASRTLSSAERNYAQIQREALAIVFGVTRFHQYTYGRRFLLRSDHKPLIHIFGPKTGIPVMAAHRLQRWALKLSAYNYELCHVPGSNNGNADLLSRLPIADPGFPTADDSDQICQIQDQNLPLNLATLAEETSKDSTLQRALKFAKNGWPAKPPFKDPGLRTLFSRRNDLSIEAGCLLLGPKLVIPKSLQQPVLDELHSGHPGSTRMKMVARSKVWWPSINEHIEAICKSCVGCCQTANRLPDPAKSNSWSRPKEPWERIHLDFAGPINGRWFLVLVDADSNWPEIMSTTKPTAATVVSFLRHVFSQHGLPRVIVTDNGTSFTADSFEDFCNQNGILHMKTAPYHPSSNGEAEKMVHIFKRSLLSQIGGEDEVIKIQRFLLSYRTTPSPATGKSPAEVLYGRNLRTRLDLLKPMPSLDPTNYSKRRFPTGEPVWILNHPSYKPKWIPGTILRYESEWIYEVDIEGTPYRRHVSHIRSRVPGKEPPGGEQFWDLRDRQVVEPPAGPPFAPDNANVPAQPQAPGHQDATYQGQAAPDQDGQRRYPSRTKRPVERLGL